MAYLQLSPCDAVRLPQAVSAGVAGDAARAGRTGDPARQVGLAVRGVFDARELAEIAAACESLCQQLLDLKRRRKWPVGASVFEMQREPFAHISEALNLWAHDPRFLEPIKDVVGVDQVGLFTEKLNVKRGRVGGPIVLHQDHPYWVGRRKTPTKSARPCPSSTTRRSRTAAATGAR
jgi:hypothetical protein